MSAHNFQKCSPRIISMSTPRLLGERNSKNSNINISTDIAAI